MIENNTKRLMSAAGIILLVILAGVGYWAYQRANDNRDLVTFNDPGLTNTENDTFNSRISEVEGKLSQSGLSEGDRYKLYLDLGANYVVIGKYAEAKTAFESAAALMPDNVVPFKELLILSGKMNDQKGAQKYYDKLVEIDPVNKEYYTQMFSEIK
jgi:lipoprotein NlpI